MKTKIILITLILANFIFGTKTMAQSDNNEKGEDKLVIVWTSDDPYSDAKVLTF
jgi:hypothetical protein